MQIYNGKKLHLQANLCEVFAENKKQNYCSDIIQFRIGSFAKDCFQPLVKRI